jgi:hypothetical protein
LDPRPKTGSPALISGRTSPTNGFYTPVAYKGAFDNNNLWIDGWTALSAYDFVPRRSQNVVQVTTNVFGSQTWYRTNEYVLNKLIYIVSNASLTIQPGTVIKGKPGGTNDSSALIVARGGKIFAEGSPEQPIIMTAEADDVLDNGDLGIYARGLWGGLVVFGNATINQAADAGGNAASPKYEIYEGLADITDPVTGEFLNRFGGNNDDDNSGVIRYVSIRHGGVKILPNKEINGLSLGGVGRGTTVDHVEAYAIADDGFEFFGGTVNTKYLVSAFCDDDCFDADMGYNGKNQFWLAIQERGAKDNGAEFNGEINGATTGTNSPIANYEVYNCTWIGAGTNTTGNRGLQLRDYAAPKIYNSIITEFGGFGVRVDATAGARLTNDLLQVRDNLWWNFATNGVPLPSVFETSQASLLFSTGSWSNEVVNPLLTSISRTNFPTFQLDPRPKTGSVAKLSNRSAPNNGFYNPVAWKGAMNSKNWAVDWTALGAYCLFSPSGGGEQLFAPAASNPAPNPVTLTITPSGANVNISLTSQAGYTYTLESALTLNPVAWETSTGVTPANPQIGTGGTLTFTVSATGTKYFQVVAN